MRLREKARHGFTLVEILIVVVILGILAAIVIPQFANASQSARTSSMRSVLQTIRSQLQYYQIQHSGNYPSNLWTQMTSATDVNGNTGTGASYPNGPYLQQAPQNAFFSGATATSVGTAGGSTVGWAYTSSSGVIYASLAGTLATSLGLTTSDVATY